MLKLFFLPKSLALHLFNITSETFSEMATFYSSYDHQHGSAWKKPSAFYWVFSNSFLTSQLHINQTDNQLPNEV